MRYETRYLAGFAALLALASCGGGEGDRVASASAAPAERISDYPAMLGEPYSVGTTRYVPADTALYDEVGYAGWYGAETTANGEPFVASAVTAAHKTLPLPSYVEITALDTGRTILARINDRGPMTNERLIDLSEGAARQLGIADRRMAGVRVRRVNPPENERAALRAGHAASARMDTPESLLKVLRDKLGKPAKPVDTPAVSVKPAAVKPATVKPEAAKPKAEAKPVAEAKPQTTASAGYVVQVAAFASRANANVPARKLNASVSPSSDGKIFRVRFGPFTTEKEAQAALSDAHKHGYPQARLLRDQL